jgi:hypothetical protein
MVSPKLQSNLDGSFNCWIWGKDKVFGRYGGALAAGFV